MNEFQALANAIIEQAAKDYRAARKKLLKNPYHLASMRTVEEVEVFFRSRWFRVLTSANGPAILKMLEEESCT